MDIQKLLTLPTLINIYSYFSLVFHIGIAMFIIYSHFIKPKSEYIDDSIIKGLGIITIVMGGILYSCGDFIIN